MKKIIITVVSIILALILAVGIAAYFLLFRDPGSEDVRMTIVDNQGNTYVAEEGKDGETFAIVADENGDIWKVEVKDDGSLGTTGDKVNDKYKIEDIITTYSGPEINESVNSDDFTGTVVESSTDKAASSDSKAAETTAKEQKTTDAKGGKEDKTTQPASQDATDTQSTTQKTTQETTQSDKKPTDTTDSSSSTPNIIRYQQMFASGTYYMEFTTNDKELGSDPIIAAAKNGNILIKASMDGLDCSMLYLADKDKTYLLIDNFKKYCSVPESMLGDDFDMNSFNLMESFASEVNETTIETDTVTINGQKLTRESYTTADGSTMRYYFDNGVLVRLDNVSESENVETYISKISSDVPDSLFEIPSNYGYLNLSWLDFLNG